MIAYMNLCDVVFVHRELSGELKVDMWVLPKGYSATSRQYMIFWDDLLVNKGVGNFRVNQADLPADLQEAMSKTSPSAL